MAARTDVFCLCLVMLVIMLSTSSAKSAVGNRVYLSRTSGFSLLGENVFHVHRHRVPKLPRKTSLLMLLSPFGRHRILSRAKYTKRLTRIIKQERNKVDSPEH